MLFAELFYLVLHSSSATASDNRIFFEPTFGTWYGTSDVSSLYGGFGELTIWYEDTEKAKIWSPGLDVITAYNHGKVNESSYTWEEKTIGGGPSIKYSDYKSEHPWHWQLKARVLFEQIDGENSTSGYEVKQQSVLLNPYTEYTIRVNRKWLWGITAEGRIAINKSIESTWKEETASNRNAVNGSLFAQYRINYHLQGRLTFTGLYQGWDENSGVELNTEIRIKEMVMLGVKGAIIDDETVVTPFIRLDFNDSLKSLNIM
ncbi:MAG: hypothetical protein D3920_10275 [Candidatus Electrothrix sp. AW2]|nr:hypothetical protein [Candidatus Electrothrix gigas]